jgi:chemotaxis protein MotB
MADEQPIIIKKKKGGHGGHHGGAWKVAYADFVTAMMALFIVLWLMSSTSKHTQDEIAGYFRDPKGLTVNKAAVSQPVEEPKKKDDMAALKKDLLHAIDDINDLNKVRKQIEITITDEGLRIELIEDANGTFFETGKTQPTPALVEILKVLADKLKSVPNHISIEGHTDAQPYVNTAVYGNWELSSDRANVARREMQHDGIREDQVSQVRGFAAQRLHIPAKPFDAANRRISLVVQYLEEKPEKTYDPSTAVAQIAATSAPKNVPPPPPAETPPSAAPTEQQTSTQKPSGGFLTKVKGMMP